MRILLVNDLSLDHGWGAERYLARLARGLVSAGETVEIFAGRVQHEGAARIRDLWDPRARRILREVVDRFRPEVVHHNNILRELSVSVLGVPRGAGTVLTVHDLRLFGVPDGAAGPPMRAAAAIRSRLDVAVARRRVHVSVAVSRAIADRLRRAGFGAVEFVPVLAPDPIQPARAVADSKDVLFAGRLTRDKGAHILIDAFRRVADRFPEADLIIAGDGPERESLEAAAVALGSRARFVGRLGQDDVLEAMGRARVVVAPVLPSLRPEGAGLTPVEAALVGRPSIVSDDVALREFVDGSGGGLVVPAGSVADLADALNRLLGDPQLASRLGEAGGRSARERHTAAAIIPKMQELYRRSLGLAAGHGA